jgi:hypothetical protein
MRTKKIAALNIVQGVQSVVQGIVQGQSRAARGLCRVCSTFLYVTRENTTPSTTKNKTALAYMGTLHTLHTLHRPRTPTPHVFSCPALAPAHPAQPLFY